MFPAFLLAAPASGSGKTTLARGLMALLRAHGLGVQPFKCGPDYIDTKMHEAVCRRPSVNLDPFFASPDRLRQLFHHYAQGADVAVVEGMMGLFDGYDRSRGSCADVARALQLPVVLVVDARAAAYSLAPVLMGLRTFDPSVRVAGVIFNKVGSERHRRLLFQTATDAGLPCLGCLPRHAALEQGSRYLGLDFTQVPEQDTLVRLLETHVDWQALLQFHSDAPSALPAQPLFPPQGAQPKERVAVARNAESFSFVYQETLDLLRTWGDLRFFDPEQDEPVPEGTTYLYLPGGYPERHAAALQRAERSRESVARYVAGGGRGWAECGGMMYLCREMHTDEGIFAMCGALPYTTTARTSDRHLSLGYRRFLLDGAERLGHEFHYSCFSPNAPQPVSVVPMQNALGQSVATPLLRAGQLWASYTHLSPASLW